jgi:hypothetical protein
MTYCFQYLNIFPDGSCRTKFYSSREMDGSIWSFSITLPEGDKPGFISLPIAKWSIKSLKLKGWRIKYSHQIIDHKK